MTGFRVSTIVSAGLSSYYRFGVNNFGGIEVELGSEKTPDEHPDHYHAFHSGDRGAKALTYLVEDHARLKSFFDAMVKLSVTEYHTGRLDEFTTRDMAQSDDEPEFAAAWDLVAEMIEEAG